MKKILSLFKLFINEGKKFFLMFIFYLSSTNKFELVY